MSEEVCSTCGGRNPPNTEFCNLCGAYLGWDKGWNRQPSPTNRASAGGPSGPGGASFGSGRGSGPSWGGPGGNPGSGYGNAADATRAIPTIPSGKPVQNWGSETDTELNVEVEQTDAVVVTPGAPPTPVTVHISNISTVVEAYRVTAINPPPWLIVTPGQARLLPGTDERVQVTLAIAAEHLVPVHRFRAQLRIQGESSPALHRDVPVDAIVGTVTAPAQLRLEPSNVRARDSTTAMFRVLLDNRRSNVPVTFDLAGRDPEQEARFGFQPVRVEVPSGGTAAASLRVDVPLPPPGEQLNRTLTVLAVSGAQELTVNAGFTQVASAIVVDPPIGVRLDPSVVHASRRTGLSHILLDNRRGTRPQRVHLEVRDVENVVQFTIAPQDLEVPAGQYAMAQVSMQAPRPEAGEEVTRSLIVTAWNGRDTVEAQGQLVQATPQRKPFLRVLLTLLGSLGMIFGSILPWTIDPQGAGVQWGYLDITRLLNVSTDPIDSVLDTLGALGLVNSLITVGGFTLFLGILAALGLFGTSGRLTRGSAVLGVVILVLFAGAMVAALFIGQGFPGLGVGFGVVMAGCALAFMGSFFPAREGP